MDLAMIGTVAAELPVPVIALGGAGEVAHLAEAIDAGAAAAASGSTFSFIGRLRAVLVTYPEDLTDKTGGAP
jgi:cyclase